VRCAIASGGGTVFKVEGASARKKWKNFALSIVTSQALKYDVLNFVSMSKQFYAMFYKPSTTPVYTTSYLSTPN